MASEKKEPRRQRALPPLETAYTQWQREEEVPKHKGWWADLPTVEVAPWERMGCLGAYVNLANQESLDAYVAEIPPGGKTHPQRYLYEEAIYVLKGRGGTTVWYDGMPKQTFEWQEGSLFSPPLNCWRQHFNGEGNQATRFVSITAAPHTINLFRDKDFIYNNPFTFVGRYQPNHDYFSAAGLQKTYNLPDSPGRQRKIWKTNFIPDVLHFEHLTDHSRWMYAPGAALSVHFNLSENTMGGHIADQKPGYYKKAHRHGPGAHLIIIRGTGYSLQWLEGQQRERVDWKPGIVFSPPDMWYHNHFVTGKEPARLLAVHWGGEHIGVSRGTEKNYGDQIEYEDEDPEIRKEFENDCRKNGVAVQMPPVIYRTHKD